MNELETKLAEVIAKLSEANELIYQARSIAQNKEVTMAASDTLLKKACRTSTVTYGGMMEIAYLKLKHLGIPPNVHIHANADDA